MYAMGPSYFIRFLNHHQLFSEVISQRIKSLSCYKEVALHGQYKTLVYAAHIPFFFNG